MNTRKYFCFVTDEKTVTAEKTYQFCVLPFGLSTVPREFAKTLALLVQLLRTRGVRVHAYLDHWIIRADSPDQSVLHKQQTIQLLQNLGWTINRKKSILEPSLILDFLGLHFDLEQAIVSPPDSFLDPLTSVLTRQQLHIFANKGELIPSLCSTRQWNYFTSWISLWRFFSSPHIFTDPRMWQRMPCLGSTAPALRSSGFPRKPYTIC